MLCALMLIALLFALHLDHDRSTVLPLPTGPFNVGRSSFTWFDDTRTDALAPPSLTRHAIVAWVWYPAVARSTSATEDYFPAAWRTAAEKYWRAINSGFIERDLALVQTHGIRDAELSPKQPRYPLVILRAGLAALTIEYTTLAEDLASHGYIVMGIDAPYRTQVVVLADGSVHHRAAENDPESFGEADGEHIANKLVAA